MQIFPFFHNLAILFSEIVILLLIGDKILCRPIRSAIIFVINKSDSRLLVTRTITDRIVLQSVLLP